MRMQLLYFSFLCSCCLNLQASQVGTKKEKNILFTLEQFNAALEQMHKPKSGKVVSFDSAKPSDSSDKPKAKDKK